MKETRNIIFITLIGSIMLGVLYELNSVKESELCVSLVTNIWCGFIVAFITSSCQLYSKRAKLINDIYRNYFEFYRTYYFAVRSKKYGRINFTAVQNKFFEISGKNIALVDEYCDVFGKNGKTYKKIALESKITWTYKKYIKNYKIFDAKAFDETYGVLISDVEKILKGINNKKFKSDCKSIENFYNKFMSKE